MGFLMGLFRRLFGSGKGTRGLQCVGCILLVSLFEYNFKDVNILLSILIGVAIYLYWCTGHWYYFKCGTEDNAYIDEQLAKGRKPALNCIVEPVCNFLKITERTKLYCFIGLLVRYGLLSLPIGFIVGWQFVIAGLTIPFIYNACFWIEFPQTKLGWGATAWAELFAGIMIGYGLY